MNNYKRLKELLLKCQKSIEKTLIHFDKKLKKINLIFIKVTINRFYFFLDFLLIQDPRRYHIWTLRYQLKIINS